MMIPILEEMMSKRRCDEPEPYETNPDEEAPLGKIRRSEDVFQPDARQLPSAYFLDSTDEDDRYDFYARQSSSNAENRF